MKQKTGPSYTVHKLKRYSTILLFVIGIHVGLLVSSVRADGDNAPLERQFSASADWVLMIETSTMDRMLKYRGSSLNPITRVRVQCYMRDLRTRQWSNAETYEDLWFNNGSPLGCERYMDLPIRSGSYGTIAIRQSKNCIEQTKAIDDTILRLELDTVLKSAVVSCIVMPLDICESAGSDLGSFNFYPTKSFTAGKTILLHVQSTPAGFNKYFTLQTK